MGLTLAQKQTLKTAILGNPTWNTSDFPNTADGNIALAEILNQLANPVFIVWKSTVTTKEIRKVIIWNEYLGCSVAEKSTFELMISNGIIEPSDANVRDGLASIFSSPNQANTRNALLQLGKRSATNIEKILATGTGSDASPATMGFESPVSYQDVMSARNLA